MSGIFRPFRVLKKSDGVMYVAMPDLLEYFRQLKETGATTTGGELMERCIDDFREIIIERIPK
jgi:hypothetical protein